MRAFVWILVAGCGFHASAVRDDDVDPGVVDAGTDGEPAAARDIPHVPAAFEAPGTSDLVLASGTVIDTTKLTIEPASNAAIDPVGQEPGGLALMLIRARTVTIPSGAVVRVSGSRPLVILADQIVIAGTLDAAGHLGKPGPNGGPLLVPLPVGAGGDGIHMAPYSDSGGGGGGHGTMAGLGGKGSTNGGGCSPITTGGPAGAPWGSAALDELRGGAAGGQGAAAACTKAVPGAGGGAVQLSALSRITVEASGILNVGGGGGSGGINCGGSDTGGGSGGGAGGALFLDAPVIMLDGVVVANGGAGGGGGSSPGVTGTPGGDAVAAASPAQGGAAGGSFGARGGNGAFGSTSATSGADNGCDGNGGGGGGGVGRIVLRAPTPTAVTVGGVVSPAAMRVTY